MVAPANRAGEGTRTKRLPVTPLIVLSFFSFSSQFGFLHNRIDVVINQLT